MSENHGHFEPSHSSDFQVDYADTDAMGVMYHGSYWRYLERARIRWLDVIGLPYKTMEASGLGLPLRAASITYFKPLRFDDNAQVLLRASITGKTQMRLDYRILCNGGLVSAAVTEHVLCKRKILADGTIQWTPTRIPDDWRNWEIWQAPNEQKF